MSRYRLHECDHCGATARADLGSDVDPAGWMRRDAEDLCLACADAAGLRYPCTLLDGSQWACDGAAMVRRGTPLPEADPTMRHLAYWDWADTRIVDHPSTVAEWLDTDPAPVPDDMRVHRRFAALVSGAAQVEGVPGQRAIRCRDAAGQATAVIMAVTSGGALVHELRAGGDERDVRGGR